MQRLCASPPFTVRLSYCQGLLIFSNGVPEEGLASCRFRNQTLIVAEKICKNNSTSIPILQKEELTVAGIHLEPICSTNFPSHNFPSDPLLWYPLKA